MAEETTIPRMWNPQPVEVVPPRTSEVQPIRLTKQQLVDNMDALSRKQTLVWEQGLGYYKQPLGTGHTFDLALALRCTCHQAQQYSGVTYELVDQESAAEILKRKCSITALLGKSLVELLQAAPLNPTGRARILAITGQMPPDTITTYDELKAWVESNCEPKTKPGGPVRPGAPQPLNGIVVQVRFREDETGSCSYSCLNTALANYEITPDMINNLMDEGGNLNDLANEILTHIQEHAWDDVDPDMESCDYEHDDYNTSGTDNRRTDLYNGTTDLVARLRTYLQATQTPERLRQLGIEQQTPF